MIAAIFSSFFAIGTVFSACFFYRQVIIDHGADLRLLLIIRRVNCLMINRCGLIFLK
jgi:hypothetical protein